MANPRHKNDSKTFAQLTFSEQAKSITANINQLQKAMRYHIEDSSDKDLTHAKCLLQINRLLGRMIEK